MYASSNDPLADPSTDTPWGNGERVLIVDDERSVLEMASVLFELSGYKVITADNAMLGFELYEKKKQHIDLVLVDLTMPIMDGAELIRILLDINPEVKIIASSGELHPPNELELRKLGICHFLPKPYDVPRLLTMIHDVIHGKEQA